MKRNTFIKRTAALIACALVAKPIVDALAENEAKWISFTTSNGHPGKYRIKRGPETITFDL
jgi:hypothetical protein